MEHLLQDLRILVVCTVIASIATGVLGIVAWRLCRKLPAISLWRLPRSAIMVLISVAIVATILAQKGDRGTGTTCVPSPPLHGGSGVSPLLGTITNTHNFSCISVDTNGVVALTAAWPEGLLSAGWTIDVLGKEDLSDESWTWGTNGVVDAGATNISWTLESPSPSNCFFMAVVRDTLVDIDDPDGDGLPNAYELAHGTNPWVHDYAFAQRLTVGPNGDFGDIVSALAASEEYSIIAVTSGVYQVDDDIQMPPHPVMVTCEEGYAVFSGATSRAMFLLGSGHDSGHTLFRNLYLNLTSTSGMQAGFWCGGGLPWAAPGAAAVFENVHIRASNPGVEYFGWLFYAPCDATAVIRGCCVNASGAEWIYAVFGDNPPPIVVESCTFVNFPAQSVYQSAAIGLRSTHANGATAVTPPVSVSHVLFDGSFTNAWPLARFEDAGGFLVTMTDCIRPSEPAAPDFMANVTNNVHVLTSQVAWAGFPFADSPAAVLGIGAFAPVPGESLDDADHDTLLDYDEVYVHGTDPFLADSDLDNILDGVELSEGTDPTDSSNYCFSCVVHLSNCDTMYTNSCCAFRLDGDILPPVFTFTTNYAVVALPHVIVTNGVRPHVFAWIDVNGNGTWEVGEPSVTRTVPLTNHVIETDIDLMSVGRDMDGDGLPDTWEVLHGLCATNNTDALADTDGDGLINLHEYWTGCDPLMPDGSNTLLSIMARPIDDGLVGKNPTNAICKFVDYQANGQNGIFILNTNCWAYSIDTSCASMWNSYSQNLRAGTAVSRRHVLVATHYPLWADVELVFCGNDGSICTNKIVASKAVGDTDITVVLLQNELPSNVTPAMILPSNYEFYLNTARYLPCILINQHESILVQEVNSLTTYRNGNTTTPQVSGLSPCCGMRSNWYEPTIDHDSGSPRFLVVGNRVVLLNLTWYGPNSPGYGSFVTSCKDSIQSVMDELCLGYALEELDMVNYQQLP